MERAITLQGVTKSFGAFRAVDGVSFEVPTGEILGLIGPNGAGKTTTIRMILDIIRPDSGEIRVLGQSLTSRVKALVGYLPEERGLYRKMKVLEMLEFHGSIKGASPGEARRQAAGWLDRLGLADWKTRKVEELSKGMQQKAQLVSAILGKPRILILDEPFSGMDPVNQNLFKEVLLGLNGEGCSIVFSTHQMETAERLCSHVVMIHKGKVVLDDPLERVKKSRGRNSVLLEYEGDGAFLEALPDVERIDRYGRFSELRLKDGADPQWILRAAAERLRITRFEVVAPTLHNIFMEMVGEERLAPIERVADA